MSIKNLTTEPYKDDQILNVNTIRSNIVSVQFTDAPAEDYGVSDTVTVSTTSGYIRFDNVPTILPDTEILVNVNYSTITPTIDAVFVTGVQIGSAQNSKLSCDVHSISNDTFSVSFFNHSTTDATSGSVAFNYLIIKGFS